MRVAAAAFLALATAALAAGCGQTGVTKSGDISHGKQLFVAKCGGCHRLQDAGTQGQTGPDLDGAFAGPRRQHFKLSTIRQVVYDQIYHAAAPMPQRLVTGADEIIISTHPEGRSNWLERGVVERARERFTVPVTHVVVDLEREQEEVR